MTRPPTGIKEKNTLVVVTLVLPTHMGELKAVNLRLQRKQKKQERVLFGSIASSKKQKGSVLGNVDMYMWRVCDVGVVLHVCNPRLRLSANEGAGSNI